MRVLEYLIQLYPEKTGKELLEIQEQEKLEEQKAFEKHNKTKLDFVNDINTNGGYYKGKFGLDQHYYYRIFDLVLEESGDVRMSVEKLVLFCNNDGHEHTVTKTGEINFERRTEDFANLDNYGLLHEERVTIKEWNAVNDYIDNIVKLFWTNAKES
jgi:hypothetical protein